MSWAAVLDTPVTGVRLRFRRALDEVTLTPEGARRLAAALLLAAERSELSPPPPVELGDAPAWLDGARPVNG